MRQKGISSFCGRRFLEALFSRVSYQVKGPLRWMAGVRLYVVPPRSPEKQGYVERAQGIHRYEFYERAMNYLWSLGS